MAQTTTFLEFHGVKAQVFTPAKQSALDVKEHGILDIPEMTNPSSFSIKILVPNSARIAICQKDIGTTHGEYGSLDQEEIEGFVVYTPKNPFQVRRERNKTWVLWHQDTPNRVDCWYLGETGELELFQIGVITHDNGEPFRLLGEHRWKGKLFEGATGYAAKPESPKWGELGPSRQAIFIEYGFQYLLGSTDLNTWNGTQEELEPPLGEIPSKQHARISWYVPFAGRNGQGIATLQDGNSAWVHGADILNPPDTDGIKRLFHGDLISFVGAPEKWGTKEGAPPKLSEVTRV